jgi:hypothetical protein
MWLLLLCLKQHEGHQPLLQQLPVLLLDDHCLIAL